MRTVLAVAIAALTLGAAACGGPKQEEFGRLDSEAIRKTTADLAAAFNAKDVDRILTLFTDNSVFMPPNAPLLRGKEPLKSFYTFRDPPEYSVCRPASAGPSVSVNRRCDRPAA